MNPFYDAYETSLSHLNEHEWNVLRHTWARGIDWYVGKVAKRWMITLPAFKGFPHYKTKKAAGEAASNLILAEARWRRHEEWERENAM